MTAPPFEGSQVEFSHVPADSDDDAGETTRSQEEEELEGGQPSGDPLMHKSAVSALRSPVLSNAALLASVLLLFLVLQWVVGAAVQYRGNDPLQRMSLFLSFGQATPSPMSLSSAYVRCDLLPNGPLDDLHAQGSCTQYVAGDQATADEYWRQEAEVYETQGQDVEYFSVHHLQQLQGLGQGRAQVSDGGRVLVLHENCAPHALNDSHPDESRPHRMAQFLQRRFGPTWLEFRVSGLEIQAGAMRFVDRSEYQPHHHALLRQGSHRRAVMSHPWQRETYQKRVDEAHFLLDQARGGAGYSTMHVHDTLPGAGPTLEFSAKRKERVHGTEVCVYEAVYGVTLPGVYNVSVWLQNVDYEHAIGLGSRSAWRRVQFALLWSDNVALTAISHAEAWNRKLPDPALTSASGPSSVSPREDSAGQLTWLYTPSATWRSLVPVYGESELLLLPVSPGLTVPFLPHTRHYGRWVHVNATTERGGSLTRPLSWNRTAALVRYAQPRLGLCQTVALADYAFVPYHLDQWLSTAPPSITAVGSHTSARPSPSAALSSRSTRFSINTGSRPFSFAHAFRCLSGRRLAMIGDSHSRTLIGRFVSIFVGAEFKFKKQKFRRREGEPRPQVEWQCVVLRVDLTRNGSTANNVGTEDQSMARDLPVSEEVEGVAPLEDGQFELCHYPSSMLDPLDVAPAFFDDGRTFDVVVLDTAQHPLQYGITLPDYCELVLGRLHAIEALLTAGLLAQTPLPPDSPAHLTRNATLRLVAALWQATSASWDASPESAGALPLTHVPDAGLLTAAVEDIARQPSLGLAELRRRSLWWSSQTFPRRNDWTSDPEKRTELRLQLTREVLRAVTALLGLDYVDAVEPISVPFEDCASDRSHIDWPAVDELFVQFYDALQQKLQCSAEPAAD